MVKLLMKFEIKSMVNFYVHTSPVFVMPGDILPCPWLDYSSAMVPGCVFIVDTWCTWIWFPKNFYPRECVCVRVSVYVCVVFYHDNFFQ